jgi:hypothetical protein
MKSRVLVCVGIALAVAVACAGSSGPRSPGEASSAPAQRPDPPAVASAPDLHEDLNRNQSTLTDEEHVKQLGPAQQPVKQPVALPSVAPTAEPECRRLYARGATYEDHDWNGVQTRFNVRGVLVTSVPNISEHTNVCGTLGPGWVAVPGSLGKTFFTEFAPKVPELAKAFESCPPRILSTDTVCAPCVPPGPCPCADRAAWNWQLCRKPTK